MRKKFAFLSLLLLLFCTITQRQLLAQNVPLSFNRHSSCGSSLELSWNTPTVYEEDTQHYLVQYATACIEGSYLTYTSQWQELITDTPYTTLTTLRWGKLSVPWLTIDDETYCQYLIPNGCSPVVVVIIHSLIEKVYAPSDPFVFNFVCQSCIGTGILTSVVDIQNINININNPNPCPPGDDRCQFDDDDNPGKTRSTAYSPKNVSILAKPNPFRSQATIEYTLTAEAKVSLHVFDIQGRLVSRLVDQQQQKVGKYQQLWQPQQLVPGIYYYQLNVDDVIYTSKIVKM